MKKGLKRLLLLLTFTILFTCALVGCESSNDTPKPSEQTSESVLSFDKTELTLSIGRETYLIAEYQPTEGLTVRYESEKPSVATIDANGKITAIGLGETTITAKYGEATATCKLVVIQGESVPSLHFSYGWSDTITIDANSSADLSSYVLFDGKTYDDHTLTYTFDETKGKIENDVFSPKRMDECAVTVRAVWRGIESVLLEKTLVVKIIPDVEFYVNDGAKSYVLYNREKVGSLTFATEMDFNVSAFENGRELSYEVELIRGSDVVKYENGRVCVLGEGVGDALLKVSCQISTGKTYELLVHVSVYASAPYDCAYFNTAWIEF